MPQLRSNDILREPKYSGVLFIEPAKAVADGINFRIWFDGKQQGASIVIPEGLEEFAKTRGLLIVNDSRATIAINARENFEIRNLQGGLENSGPYASQISFAGLSRTILLHMEAEQLSAITGKPVMESARANAGARTLVAKPEAALVNV